MNNTITNIESIQALKAQIKELSNKVSEIETQENIEIQSKVGSIPQYLGVKNMEEALAVIKKNRNVSIHGVNQGKRTWGKGREIPENVRKTVQDLLKSKEHTVSEISQKTGVSTASINKLKKMGGLVRNRTPKMVMQS